jgi:hypothetical protein
VRSLFVSTLEVVGVFFRHAGLVFMHVVPEPVGELDPDRSSVSNGGLMVGQQIKFRHGDFGAQCGELRILSSARHARLDALEVVGSHLGRKLSVPFLIALAPQLFQ